jgi:hypothetical protein
LSFYEGVGFGVLKIEELESELLCTDSTALAAGTPRIVSAPNFFMHTAFFFITILFKAHCIAFILASKHM